MEGLLPDSWTPESEVRYTARILEKPSHTDSQTIIRDSRWKIILWGYEPLVVGEEYVFSGRVEPRVTANKQVQIVMMDPSFEIVPTPLARGGVSASLRERMIIGLSYMRERMVDMLSSWLPEPHASLSAGILLGVRREMPGEFYQQLVSTGTLHIIAASGYNTTIVARVVMGMLLLVFSRGVAILGGIGAIIAYVVIAGGSAAVVRSAIMGSIALTAYYWGREAEAKRLLWVTVGLMVVVQPLMLLDVGFQLSVVATAGLLYVEPWLQRKFKITKNKLQTNSKNENMQIENGIQMYLGEYWWPTVAATLATMPVIYYTFGRVSWISPVVNMIVLPLTPLIMLLSAVAVGVGGLNPVLGQVVSWALYVPLWMMVEVIAMFG